MKQIAKKALINQLQQNILHWQGYKTIPSTKSGIMGLGPIETAFPNAVFPTGAIHEFLSGEPEHAAACCGFIGGLLQTLMQSGKACLWIGRSRTLFPPALKAFGVDPDRVIFIDLIHEKDILWVLEEALKCEVLCAVVAELGEVSFAQTLRLQLIVEKSRVTAFIVRKDINKLSTTTCVARWKITPLPSESEDGMPGPGFPRWNVELLKVRNGSPGAWKMEWCGGKFMPLADKDSLPVVVSTQRRKAG